MAGEGFFTTGSPGIVAPESIGPLIIQPLSQQSVALRVSNVVPCATQDYRFPKIVSRPLAHWVAEGQPLTEEDPGVDEEICTPKKLTALVKISREMASDSISPGAAAIVGQAVVEQIQRQLDQAYFGSNVADPNQPAGLEDLQGHQSVDIEGPLVDFAWAVKAESLLNQVGATATAFVANASTVEVLATLREFQETTTVKSNEFLLSPDPTQATKYAVNGTPLFWTPDDVVEDGTVWALCGSGANPKAFVVQRLDVELITSPWPFFSDDCVALRAVLRYGFSWPHAAAVVKIQGVMPGS